MVLALPTPFLLPLLGIGLGPLGVSPGNVGKGVGVTPHGLYNEPLRMWPRGPALGIPALCSGAGGGGRL